MTVPTDGNSSLAMREAVQRRQEESEVLGVLRALEPAELDALTERIDHWREHGGELEPELRTVLALTGYWLIEEVARPPKEAI